MKIIFQAPSWRLEEVVVLAKLRAANKPAQARRFVSLGSSGFATLAYRSLRSTTLPSPANPHKS